MRGARSRFALSSALSSDEDTTRLAECRVAPNAIKLRLTAESESFFCFPLGGRKAKKSHE